MEHGTELCRIYCGDYTVYQREDLYCFLPKEVQTPQLSVQESLALGGCYLFCPASDEETFPSRLLAYLKKWRTPPLFLWLENPLDDLMCWRIHKLERYGGGQKLLLDRYRLELRQWQDLTVEGEDFLFHYSEAGGFGFGSGRFRLPGGAEPLRLMTLGQDCGVFSGSLQVSEEVCPSLMEQLHAGVCYCCVDEKGDEQAMAQGFLEHAYSQVLEPQGAIRLVFRLTPHRLLEPDWSYFSLAGYAFHTRLSTRTGQQVNVTAQEDGRLVFQQRPVLAYRDEKGQLHTRTSLYLGLSGTFSPEKKAEYLLCGLSGTENLVLQEDACLRFYPSMPAVEPYQNQALGTTSWVGGAGGGNYYCQPEQSVLYSAVEQQGLRMLELPAATFAQAVPPVPLLPYFGLTLKGRRDESQWEEGLYRERHAVLLGKNTLCTAREDNEGICAVTPQGLMAKVAPDGQYQWLGIATFAQTQAGSPPDLYFAHIDREAQAQFQQKEILYVIDSATAMEALNPSQGFCFSLEGIRFDLRPAAWRADSAQPTMLLIQYSPARSMREALQDDPVFQSICQSAYTENGELRSGYEPLIAAVDDPHFEGILALNTAVIMDSLPPEMEFLMNSVEQDRFYAAYLVIGAGQIRLSDGGQPVLTASSVDGLIDYSSEAHLNYSSEPPDYDYLTTEIRISIQESRLVSFYSSSEVLVNRLFEAKAQAYENPDGNCLILQGRMVEKNQTRVYQYELKQGVNYTLSGSGIASVWVSRLDLVAGETGGGQFQLSGTVSCQAMEGADLLGFGGETPQQGLPFSQLVLWMEPGDQGTATHFSMEYGQLQFHQEDAIVREGSFPQVFAVRLDSLLLEQNGQTPEQKGYTSMNTPVRQGTPGDSYQGFIWTLAVGSLGGLSGQGVIQLRLLTAFWAGAQGNTEYYLGIQLPGAGGGDIWKLQGLFQMGFDSVSLEKAEGNYTIRLHGFQIQLLGTSFPEGNNDIILFSDGKQIGWYAAYEGEES